MFLSSRQKEGRRLNPEGIGFPCVFFMKKFSIMVAKTEPTRRRHALWTFKADSLDDAMSRFKKHHQCVIDDPTAEVVAVWQCCSCDCRANAKVRPSGL